MGDQIDFEKALFGEAETTSKEVVSSRLPEEPVVSSESVPENYDDTCVRYNDGYPCYAKGHNHTPRK